MAQDGERLSEWALRQGAERAGYAIAHEQFRSYVDWGLLPEAEGGTWNAGCIERLVEIRQHATVARQLPRRVVLLRADYLKYPVPNDRLREAMAQLAPMVKAPITKLKRVHAAAVRFGAIQAGVHPESAPSIAALPRPAEWPRLFRAESLTDDVFGSRATAAYYLVRILETRARELGVDLSGIPFEELVLLTLVRDLAQLGPVGWWRKTP